MGLYDAKECPCASGELRTPQFDARGIFTYFFCSKCEKGKRSKYRPDIFTDSNYWADEPIDEE